MKILFSPSETKSPKQTSDSINENSFIFSYLYEKRYHVLARYQTLLEEHHLEKLEQLFGLKDEQKILLQASKNIFTTFTCKAIERYTGIAYDHLLFDTLDKNAQMYLETNVMIFSNLFGPILAGDMIPEYKLQQGQSLDGFKSELFYKEHFSNAIDEWIGEESVLDLRAGFYEKFYTLKRPYVTMKFLKNGKIVSHFAKAYRGQVLREVAFVKPRDEKELGNISFSGLRIREIIEQKLKREYVFDIID
ncbi:YaaA family protein [Sulfurospirillum oryzae]|uniref:YaaA family protein n=1 Tax=Sulfurospirillum oryzae TaxID=2976535 RepID=UPI0021E719C6|nr:YaaA family protein [Sulfurospirillum oryzae]